jgi:hypothetical protein
MYYHYEFTHPFEGGRDLRVWAAPSLMAFDGAMMVHVTGARLMAFRLRILC